MDSSASARPGRGDATLVAGSVVLTVVLLPWGHLLGPDAGVFSVVARMWLDGAVPYRDVFLAKPPFLVVVNAVGDVIGGAVGLGPSDGPRLMSAVSVVVLAVALYRLVRALGAGSPAASLVGLAAVFYFADGAFAGGGGLSEPPAFALALLAWCLAEGSPSVGRLVLAGALSGAALATSILAAAILVGVVMAVASSQGGGSDRLVRLTVLVAGGLLVAAPVVAWLGVDGALPAMWDQLVTYTRAYGAVSCPIPGLSNWPCFSDVDRVPILTAYLMVVAPVFFAAILAARVPLSRAVQARLVLIVLAGVVLGLPTLRRAPSDHYWWPIVIALLPLAALGLDVLVERLRRPGARSLPVVATVLVLFLAGLGTWRLHASLGPPTQAAEDDARWAGAAVDSESTSGPLFVWGMASSIYLVSTRQPAGEMLHLYALSLPGYADAERFASVCRLFADRRPIIVEDDPDLALEPGAPTPAGIDPAWIEPIRRLVAVDWRRTSALGVARILVPRDDPQLDARACGPGA